MATRHNVLIQPTMDEAEKIFYIDHPSSKSGASFPTYLALSAVADAGDDTLDVATTDGSAIIMYFDAAGNQQVLYINGRPAAMNPQNRILALDIPGKFVVIKAASATAVGVSTIEPAGFGSGQ